MDRQPPVVIPLLIRDIIDRRQNISGIKVMLIISFVVIPVVIDAEIDIRLRILTSGRIVKNAHRFLKFGRIKPEVHRIHIVPGLMLVDLVGDHPVGYKPVLFA